jgi:outer membrane autotransporter protein
MNKWYMNATLGLGYHDYKSNRVALTDYVKGNHDAWQYTAKLDAGYPFQFNAFTIAPVASIGYSRLNENGYTESGIGALAIGSRGSDSLRSGLGAKAMIPVLEGDVNAGIELRALWNHEFMNTNQDTTARFVDGGGTFTSSGINQRRDGADLGASIRLAGVMDGIQHTLMINYDAQIKPQYLNQTASLHARFDF